MKKILSLLICLLLLFTVACGEQSTEQQLSRVKDGSIIFTAENLPKICATPYTEQMAVNFVTAVVGCDAATAKTLITVCETTDDCYENLLKSKCDIVIAHDYGQDIITLLDSTELGIIMTELQRDALVFTTNGKQGVESVTTEQLKALFSGEITDWEDLGGVKMPVVLFGATKRTAQQNAFEKYVSAEIVVPAVTKSVVTLKGTFTTEIGYDNRNGALGYTLLSLAGSFSGGSIKPLAVDGVAVSEDTLENGQYPFKVSVNIAVRNSESAKSNTKLLYDWSISEQGKLAIGKLY